MYVCMCISVNITIGIENRLKMDKMIKILYIIAYDTYSTKLVWFVRYYDTVRYLCLKSL